MAPEQDMDTSSRFPSLHTVEDTGGRDAETKGKRNTHDAGSFSDERDVLGVQRQYGSFGSAETQSHRASGSLRRKPGSRDLSEVCSTVVLLH